MAITAWADETYSASNGKTMSNGTTVFSVQNPTELAALLNLIIAALNELD